MNEDSIASPLKKIAELADLHGVTADLASNASKQDFFLAFAIKHMIEHYCQKTGDNRHSVYVKLINQDITNMYIGSPVVAVTEFRGKTSYFGPEGWMSENQLRKVNESQGGKYNAPIIDPIMPLLFNRGFVPSDDDQIRLRLKTMHAEAYEYLVDLKSIPQHIFKRDYPNATVPEEITTPKPYGVSDALLAVRAGSGLKDIPYKMQSADVILTALRQDPAEIKNVTNGVNLSRVAPQLLLDLGYKVNPSNFESVSRFCFDSTKHCLRLIAQTRWDIKQDPLFDMLSWEELSTDQKQDVNKLTLDALASEAWGKDVYIQKNDIGESLYSSYLAIAHAVDLIRKEYYNHHPMPSDVVITFKSDPSKDILRMPEFNAPLLFSPGKPHTKTALAEHAYNAGRRAVLLKSVNSPKEWCHLPPRIRFLYERVASDLLRYDGPIDGNAYVEVLKEHIDQITPSIDEMSADIGIQIMGFVQAIAATREYYNELRSDPKYRQLNGVDYAMPYDPTAEPIKTFEPSPEPEASHEASPDN